MKFLKSSFSDMISCSSSTQICSSSTSNFSLWYWSQILIDLGYIHWTLTLSQLDKFQLNVSQYVWNISSESHCTKIIVARILKLTVSYVCIKESPKFNEAINCFSPPFKQKLISSYMTYFRILCEKLTVSYVCIKESVWHWNTEPKFRTRLVKKLRPGEKFIFEMM